ncbi:hypothetical protein GH733_017316, partial [Mirounga leonina]
MKPSPCLFRTTGEETLKTIFLLQIGVGSFAGVILFSHNIPPILHGHKQRLFNMILTYMAVANLLVLLSTGIPLTMAAFVFRQLLSTLGCTLVHYIHQMAWSTTLCSTAPNTSLVFLWCISDAMFMGLMWLDGADPAQASPESVVYSQPQWSPQIPPETRAAHTILMLVTTCVVFYMLNSIFAFYVITLIGSYL